MAQVALSRSPLDMNTGSGPGPHIHGAPLCCAVMGPGPLSVSMADSQQNYRWHKDPRPASNLTEGVRLFIIGFWHRQSLYQAHSAFMSSSSTGEMGVWPTSPVSEAGPWTWSREQFRLGRGLISRLGQQLTASLAGPSPP